MKLLAAAWDLEIGSTEKMVLMCLCDHANAEGACWPSVARICRKTSKSERTVQAALKWLREAGYFTVERQRGPTPLYRLDPSKLRTPADVTPPQHPRRAPAKAAPEPSGNPQDSDSARGLDDGDAGEGMPARAASLPPPSRDAASTSSSSEEPALIITRSFRAGSSLSKTEVEKAAEPPFLDTPSRQARSLLEARGGEGDAVPIARGGEEVEAAPTRSDAAAAPGIARRARGKAQARFALPGWVPAEPWEAFVEMRRETGHKLTDRAKRLAVAELERLRDAGEDPGAVLDQSTLRAWRGLFAVTRADRWGRGRPDPHGESWRGGYGAGRGAHPAAQRAAGAPVRTPLPVTADGRVTREGSIRALIERAALYRKIGREDDAREAERDAARLRCAPPAGESTLEGRGGVAASAAGAGPADRAGVPDRRPASSAGGMPDHGPANGGGGVPDPSGASNAGSVPDHGPANSAGRGA